MHIYICSKKAETIKGKEILVGNKRRLQDLKNRKSKYVPSYYLLLSALKNFMDSLYSLCKPRRPILNYICYNFKTKYLNKLDFKDFAFD